MKDFTYPTVIASARLMFRVLNLKFELIGGEHVPTQGGAVLASNHVSYLDFIFCGYATQPSNRLVRFMAKKSTFDHRISGPLMRSMHHIPVDRSAGANAFDEALASLRGGEVVGVFPEATISQSFEPKDFKTGAVRLAAESEVPLVPMTLFGGQRLWTKGRKRDMERGTLISLVVGEPMEVTTSDDPTKATEELRNRMEALYERMIADYAQAPSPEEAPDTWWWPARFGGGAPTPDEVIAAAKARREEKAENKDG